MTLSRYYAALLRHNEDMAPTLEEAEKDYRRAVDLSQIAVGFCGY